MKLWTEQPRDFNLTEGRRDSTRSNHGPSTRGEAYERLHQLVGTDQFLWCSAQPPSADELAHRDPKMVYWAIDVPTTGIVALVDGLVWHRILGFEPPKLDPYFSQFVAQARSEVGSDAFKIDMRAWELNREFWNRPPPYGTWWDHLLAQNIDHDRHVQPLVRFPIDPTWIVGEF